MRTGRLWVVSELFYPEETSTGYFLTKIAEGLAERFEVHAICSRPTYSERHLEVPWSEKHHAVHIHRMRSSRFGKDSLLGRALNLATFSIAAALFALMRVKRADAMLVVTNPPTIPPLMGIIARLRGARAHLLVHDVYPEVLVATGLLAEDGLATRLLGRLTAATYRLYRTVVVLGRDMADLAQRRLSGEQARVIIIPNWGDVDEVKPLEVSTNPFAALYNPSGRTLVQFSGNIGRTHDVETVIAAARLLADREDVTIQFVGGGAKARSASDAGDVQGNVAYLPRQPREMLGPMLSAADAVVISFVDRMLGVSVPSRMYNVMAAGTPIIAMAHRDSELARVVAEEGCGWTLAPGDACGLAAVIERIATPRGREESRERGLKGRDAALRLYSLPIVLDQFAALLGASTD
jgi:glycosyltransferase involved in cell wall biosynthesis